MGCWGDGGAVAVMEKRRGRAGAGDGYGGCYGAEAALLRAKKEAGKTKNGRWALRANVGELKAHPGRPGRGGQGAGDARPHSAPRGDQRLKWSATEEFDSVGSDPKCDA